VALTSKGLLSARRTMLGTRSFVVPIAGALAVLLSCSSDQVGYDVKFEVIPETKTKGPGCDADGQSWSIPLDLVTYSEGIFGLLDCGTLNFRGEGETSEPVEITGRADIWDACGEHFSWAEFQGNVPVGRYVITSEGVATDTMTGVVPVSFFQDDSERFFRYLMSDGTACATGPSPSVRARAVFEWSVCGETTRDGMIRLVVEGTCKLAPPSGTVGTGGTGGTVGTGGTGGTSGTGGTGGGGPVCGDDTIQAPEVCDGSDLGTLTGLTCADFGFTGGTLACNATCDNLNLTACAGGPPGWTCEAYLYGAADGCDCGCGVIDPDCIDGTVASCEYCDAVGSCTPIFDAGCPGDIDPAQNWLCQGGTQTSTVSGQVYLRRRM